MLIEQLLDWAESARALIWGPPLILLLLGTGVYFSVRLGFFQVLRFPLILRKTLLACLSGSAQRTADRGAISPFASMCTALAATVGTGNIAGVATALTLGGPGAVFWMWVSAFFGMATAFAEHTLTMLYRERGADGALHGGPMYYLRKGLHSPLLAGAFALFCMLASFGIGNLSQCNSIAVSLHDTFGVPTLLVGALTALALAVTLLGGLTGISAVTERLVPFMALFYVGGALLVLVINRAALPDALGQIVSGAFDLRAGVGGAAGYGMLRAVQWGVERGVFSNEAGLGSSAMVSAAADTAEPCEQGMWAIFEVFVDTIVMCTVTALVVLSSGAYDAVLYAGAAGTPALFGLATGSVLTAQAFSAAFGALGGAFIAVALTLFAFSTLLGWSYYGERCASYLFGADAVPVYRFAFIGMTVVGCTMQLSLAWTLSDVCNGLMALPNLIGVLALSGEVCAAWRLYQKRLWR